MIDALMISLKLMVALLPFLYLCRRNENANLDKSERSHQFLMPVVALVYTIVAMFFIGWLNEKLLWLVRQIPIWLMALAALLPEKIGGLVAILAGWIANGLRAINLPFWIFFVSNCVIFLVYLIVKKIALANMKRAFGDDSYLHTVISGRFYEYVPEKSKWCLQESYVQARNFLCVFYCIAVGLAVALSVVSR